MYGPTQPLGNITDQWARIEFQKRDSPHVHSLLWVKEAPNLDTIQGQRDAPTFIDKFIKTTISADDDQLKEYVTTYQIHRHTHICKKNRTKCHFNFTRQICHQTFLKTNLDPVKTTHFYETFRTAEDLWVNAYNPTILKIFQSNMDIQLIGSKYGAAAYVCAYRKSGIFGVG